MMRVVRRARLRCPVLAALLPVRPTPEVPQRRVIAVEALPAMKTFPPTVAHAARSAAMPRWRAISWRWSSRWKAGATCPG